MPTTFTIERSNLRNTRWAESERLPLGDGAVRFHVDSFALTSNNVTYAAFGETMNYWGFFPTGSASTGCIPVWGFADVIESHCEGIEVGERFYGYWPIADEAVLLPVNLKRGSFVDGAPHRRELHALYNQYTRCSADPAYAAAQEAQQALLRPLFITSFVIDDFLADNGFFGARRVILSSASSKTAYGTAFCLSQRRGTDEGVEVIGLTSPGNLDFTHGLGCYDQVVRYADVATLPAATPVVYVDFSGDATLRATIHSHWSDELATAARSAARIGTPSAAAKAWPGRARCNSLRRHRSRSAWATGDRAGCSSAWPKRGARSWCRSAMCRTRGCASYADAGERQSRRCTRRCWPENPGLATGTCCRSDPHRSSGQADSRRLGWWRQTQVRAAGADKNGRTVSFRHPWPHSLLPHRPHRPGSRH